VAGGPGDRWFRQRSGEVNSPLQSRDGRKVRTPSSARKSQRGNTPRPSGLGVKGNAPANARGAVVATAFRRSLRRLTESATENRPPAERSTVASRRETCETSSNRSHRLARVKRWGKSPPPRWQHRGHGKPRVVQGQIGGESRPGSMSQRS
jgi:hypothetical protein